MGLSIAWEVTHLDGGQRSQTCGGCYDSLCTDVTLGIAQKQEAEESHPKLGTFACRFKTPEQLQEFMECVNANKAGSSEK